MSIEKSESYPAEQAATAKQTFRQKVLALVAEIPTGKVATYGQIALLAGRPRAARQVGGVLHGLSGAEAAVIPWQRVINVQGGISTYKVGAGELQRALLEAEGVTFDLQGRCDLEHYRFAFEGFSGLSGAT